MEQLHQAETLLRLIYKNELSDKNIVPHLNVINYSNDCNFTPLMNAIYYGKREAALLLLKNKADPAIQVVSTLSILLLYSQTQ